jgi:anti-sigma-K factor RskA
MTPVDEYEREPGGDDILAAEYVLGALPAEERRAVARRIEVDADFARLVEGWEQRLFPLSADYAEVEPPASVKAALDQKLFVRDERQVTIAAGLWHSLAFWRGLAAAALTALVLYIAVSTVRPPVEADQLVASLAADDSDVRYVAVYDPVHSRVGLSHVSGARASGRDFQLWVIETGAQPVSLGVIPEGESVGVSVQEAHRRLLGQNAALAISLEPEGGSPTGQPTGPVVAAGTLRKI